MREKHSAADTLDPWSDVTAIRVLIVNFSLGSLPEMAPTATVGLDSDRTVTFAILQEFARRLPFQTFVLSECLPGAPVSMRSIMPSV
jgi:hypothetical protein